MNDVELMMHNEMKRSTFAEAVNDDEFDFLDNMSNEDDYTDAESVGDQ